MAGVGDVFNMPAAGIIAVVFLHAADAGPAGEHFGDGFDFDIAQTAGVEEGRPALVSRELSSWTEVNKYPFILATGGHVSAILNLEPATISKICKFLTQAEHQTSVQPWRRKNLGFRRRTPYVWLMS
ncbi:hypothetical protein [Pantoea sp. BAV 3049]|uniref:hypothetical protein n=1 Tax=Pantoea sp. BAV 3049 TaxID=2654188 RepID=UPI001E5805A4|nr:hypothetical protein [Pantoea sp. BAV 3049]